MIDKSLIKDCKCGSWIVNFDPVKASESGKTRLKFTEGDRVYVRKSNDSQMSFKSSYHPKWIWPSMGHMGTIIGRRAVYGAYVKYAVRVDDLKTVFPIHSNFLRKVTEEEGQMIALMNEFPEMRGTWNFGDSPIPT